MEGKRICLYGYRLRSATLMQNNVIRKFTGWQATQCWSFKWSHEIYTTAERYCVWHYQIEQWESTRELGHSWVACFTCHRSHFSSFHFVRRQVTRVTLVFVIFHYLLHGLEYSFSAGQLSEFQTNIDFISHVCLLPLKNMHCQQTAVVGEENGKQCASHKIPSTWLKF